MRIDRPKPSTPTWPPPESGSVDSSSEAAAAPWPPSLSQRPPFQAPSNPFRFSLPAVPSPFATPSFPQPTPAPPTPLAIELVVDRSASMAPLLKGTVSGVNKFLANQWRAQAELDQRSGGCGGGGGEGGQVFRPPQQATVSLTTFDDTIEQVWNKVPLQRFYPFASNRLHLSPAMVRPRGRTALLDAIGSTLVKDGIGVCVIVTGGHENASRTFNRSEIVTLIEARKQEGWSFVFLAANQDAIATGRSLGIHERNACTFGGSAAGVAAGWASASDQIAQNRTQGTPLGFGFAQRQACAAGDPAALGVLHSRKNDGLAFGS